MFPKIIYKVFSADKIFERIKAICYLSGNAGNAVISPQIEIRLSLKIGRSVIDFYYR